MRLAQDVAQALSGEGAGIFPRAVKNGVREKLADKGLGLLALQFHNGGQRGVIFKIQLAGSQDIRIRLG